MLSVCLFPDENRGGFFIGEADGSGSKLLFSDVVTSAVFKIVGDLAR